MNWLDWALIIIMALSTWQGLRTGLILGIARLAGLIGGLVIAFTWHRTLALYLDSQWGWGDKLAFLIMERMPLPLLEGLMEKMSFNGIEQLLQDYGILETSTLPQEINDSLWGLSYHLAMSALDLISFLLLLFATVITVSIIFKIIAGTIAHTFLSPFDRLGGLILGFTRGVIVVLIVVMLIQSLLVAGTVQGESSNGFWGRAAKSSVILPYTYQVLDIINLQLPGFSNPGRLLEAKTSNKI